MVVLEGDNTYSGFGIEEHISGHAWIPSFFNIGPAIGTRPDHTVIFYHTASNPRDLIFYELIYNVFLNILEAGLGVQWRGTKGGDSKP